MATAVPEGPQAWASLWRAKVVDEGVLLNALPLTAIATALLATGWISASPLMETAVDAVPLAMALPLAAIASALVLANAIALWPTATAVPPVLLLADAVPK